MWDKHMGSASRVSQHGMDWSNLHNDCSIYIYNERLISWVFRKARTGGSNLQGHESRMIATAGAEGGSSLQATNQE